MNIRQQFLWRSFKSLYFGGGVIFVLVQQTLVALSIFALAGAAQRLSEPADAVPWLIGFVICTILPYTPGILADRQFQLWFTESLEAFFSTAISANPFSPRHFSLTDIADEKTAIFASNAPEVIYDFCNYVPAILTAGLNATLVLLVVAGVADLRILVTYMVSFALCSILIFWFGPWAAKAANSAESRRSSLVGVGMNLWPNLVLGNSPNIIGWRHLLEKTLNNYKEAIRRQAFVQSISQQSIAIASFGPTSILFVYLCYSAIQDPTKLAILLAVAPRVFQILLSLHDFSTMIFAWHQVKGRLALVDEYFKRPDADHFQPLSEYRSVKATNLTDPTECVVSLSDLSDNTTGRVVLTGPNGAGKTSALLLLKERLGAKSIFIPSQSKLVFDTEEPLGSTGQRKLYELAKLNDLPEDITHILLDEWDANLDSQNVDFANSLIEDLSHKKMVIEIRHKNPNFCR